jgi:hypothetical protein
MATFDRPGEADEYDGDVPTVNPTWVARPTPARFDGQTDATESQQNKFDRKKQQ